jgi:hypothetical protein
MKNNNAQSWILQSSALAMTLALLSGCGTEIGNGRKPPVLPEGGKNTTPNAAPDKADSETTDGSTDPTSESAPLPTDLDYLFIACGSPIPDLKAGTYLESVDSSSLVITLPMTGSWSLAVDSETYTVEKNTAANSQYAIKSSDVTLGSQTCSQPTTVINGSETEKTIVYSDNYRTTWLLDSNSKVTNIKILDPNGAIFKDWTAQ